MWEHEAELVTDVPVGQLWDTFVAVHSGRLTLPGGDVFAPEGELAVGTRIAVTPAGQETMTSIVTTFDPHHAYADETEFNGLVLTFGHSFEPTDAGTRIVHRLTITGEGADVAGPEIGPQISADFPEQLRALVQAAGRG